MKKEVSCGAVTFDEDGKVLIIKHLKGHIDIPKGHIEGNETKEETAIREVKEETNIDIEIDNSIKPTMITYSPKDGVIKDVYFFVAKALTHDTKPQEEEVSHAYFVDPKEALNLLTFDNAKDVLKYALNEKCISIN